MLEINSSGSTSFGTGSSTTATGVKLPPIRVMRVIVAVINSYATTRSPTGACPTTATV